SSKLSGDFINTIFDIQKECISTIIKRGVQSNQLRRDVRNQYLVTIIHSTFIGLLRGHFLDKTTLRKNDFTINLNQCLNLVFEGIK
ncbi:MAG: hypothetical protein GY865_17735, partial [candidate division Zixibacteria bacterium]|nr:hypothetical protein [candidate division Zixibacteria bacterium]